METNHTPEPWDLETVSANTRRVVACVNACAGISTEVLEGLTGQELNDMLLDNARVVAALKAVRDIPTEALEAGVVGELVEALQLFVDIYGPSIDHFGEGAGPGEIDSVRKGRGALAKAKGETA